MALIQQIGRKDLWEQLVCKSCGKKKKTGNFFSIRKSSLSTTRITLFSILPARASV